MEPFKIARIAKQRGKTPNDLLIEEFATHGSLRRVAKELNVSRDTLKRWIADQGMVIKRCVKLEREA